MKYFSKYYVYLELCKIVWAYFYMFALNQHASKFILIFMKILKMYVKYWEENKESNLYITNGTFNPRKLSIKDVKICKNSPYCDSHAEEIR
jgi:hypothetical protein